MGQIESLFFNYPNKLFHMREISRITGIPKSTVARSLAVLLEEQLILKDKDVFTGYRANASSSYYVHKKILFALDLVFSSKIIDFFEEKLMPRSVILFGSFAKGEFSENSDIDIFLECAEQDIDIRSFEEFFHRDIQLFMAKNIKDVPVRLANNILNGVRLSGFVNVL